MKKHNYSLADTVRSVIAEVKKVKPATIRTSEVKLHHAEYLDNYGRWMSAGYHDTAEEAERAAKRNRRNNIISSKRGGSISDPGRDRRRRTPHEMD
jgi:short-subunit dehydrogenase